jgi:hypothetical protein
MTAERFCGRSVFDHVGMSIEPDWSAFGTSEATAAADLIQLAEQLGCWGTYQPLQSVEALCWARGAAAILAAVEQAGGAQALAAADPDAAACICHGLLAALEIHGDWMPSDVRRRVADAFAALEPSNLRAAAARLRSRAPGCLRGAYHAIQSIHVSLGTAEYVEDLDEAARSQLAMAAAAAGQVRGMHLSCCGTCPSDQRRATTMWSSVSVCTLAHDLASRCHKVATPMIQLHPTHASPMTVHVQMAQGLAPDCLVLLRAIADALREWSASRASQQQQQQQQLLQAPVEMLQTGTLLSRAASSLLHCIHTYELWHAIAGQQLPDALRHLLRTVLLCWPVHMHME